MPNQGYTKLTRRVQRFGVVLTSRLQPTREGQACCKPNLIARPSPLHAPPCLVTVCLGLKERSHSPFPLGHVKGYLLSGELGGEIRIALMLVSNLESNQI